MSTAFAQLAATPDTVPPDPSKHVNYTLGMLLGVEDFNQDFAFHSGRHQQIARDLVGYGTVSGLKLSLDITAKGPRVSVTCGTAVSPRGQFICLHPAQCAYLNDWLVANQSSVFLTGGSPPGSLRLWLMLCYRECPVDAVPIAGEPCRSAGDLMAPSRLIDDFRLDFRTAPNEQNEEDAIRDFVAWLDQIQITDAPGVFPTLDQFVNGLRADLTPGGSPPDPVHYFQFGSPLSRFHVHPSDIGEYLRAAFRVWATEIRALFHSQLPGQGCSCGDVAASPPPDECLLLAEIDVPVVKAGGNWVVDEKQSVVIDESRRPILLHSRMMQEWMLSGLRGGK